MEKENNEIPFGAKDSELYKFEYAIPEGMEAIIDGNKVIIRKKESEDERIKNLIYCIVRDRSDVGKLLEANGCPVEKALSWIEEQKEPKLESCDCSRDEESYTNGIHHVLMNPEAYGLIKQKPAEWSNEDRTTIERIVETIQDYAMETGQIDEVTCGTKEPLITYIRFLRSLRPQPHWKPSDGQMKILRKYVMGEWRDLTIGQDKILTSLYNDLKSL